MSTTYTYTTSNAVVDYCLQKAADEYNAATGQSLTAAQYWQMDNDGRAQEVVARFARISIADAMARLTPAEFARINAARAASPAVAEATRPIFTSRSVILGGPLWVGGVTALAGAGLLDTPTPARVAALLAPPQPGEVLVTG